MCNAKGRSGGAARFGRAFLGLLGAAVLSYGQIHFTEVSEQFQVKGYSDFGGHGVSWVDVNGDGRVDIFVKNEGARGVAAVADILYINYGGSFVNEAGSRGVADAYAYGTHGAVFVDWDGDRDFDLFASTTYAGISPAHNHLYQNNGNAFFQDVTSSIIPAQTVDLTTRGVAAADFDGDGDIDLYFSNPLSDPDYYNPLPSPPRSLPNFYINNGNGTFTAEYRGIDWTGFVQGVTTGDFDDDGDIDIAQAMWGPPSTIYRNDGTGYFRNVGGQVGISTSNGEFDNGVVFADFDNDGDLDMAIVGQERIALYRNAESSYYRYQVIRWDRAISGFQVCFGDFDNDAVLELYLSGENVYENDGEGHFSLIPTSESGLEDSLAIADPRGAALADFDNDGDLDIYVTNKDGYNRLFRNDLNNSDWIEVEIMSDPQGHSGGIGSKLDLYTAGHVGDKDYLKGHREITGEYGYLGQDSPVAHFGAPAAGGARYDLRVTFPDGTQKIYAGLTPGQKVLVAPISPPLDVQGRMIENKALFYRETLIELSWQPNPLNNDVQAYRVYELNQGQIRLAELPETQFTFTVRNLDKTRAYHFAVTAVDSLGLESEPVTVSVNGSPEVERRERQLMIKSLKGEM
ncbi:MAG: VCBS repeat-containing protein [Candidatus Aminicenantes bacterium]|nr:VCBS repeat-containing protein [Candidatus Aminicenantes bacterium]